MKTSSLTGDCRIPFVSWASRREKDHTSLVDPGDFVLRYHEGNNMIKTESKEICRHFKLTDRHKRKTPEIREYKSSFLFSCG